MGISCSLTTVDLLKMNKVGAVGAAIFIKNVGHDQQGQNV